MKHFIFWMFFLGSPCIVLAQTQVPITSLPAANAQNGSEVLPENQTGSCPSQFGTCKVTTAQLASYTLSLVFGDCTINPSTSKITCGFNNGIQTVQEIASGSATLGTSSIASGSCASVVTSPASGALTTDVIDWGFNSDPTSTVGYVPSSSGMLTIIAYPTSGSVNFKVCNNTASAITPGAVTLNWKVIR